MAGTKSPRKNLVHGSSQKTQPNRGPYAEKTVGGKLPAEVKKLKSGKTIIGQNPFQVAQRPRRFSLIYSSDSSTDNISEPGRIPVPKTNHPRPRALKSITNNSMGKKGRLINRSDELARSVAVESDNSVENSDDRDSNEHKHNSSSDSDSDEDDEDDDDDDESDSDSDDEIDFVKLSAQRKKRAMKALSSFTRFDKKHKQKKEAKLEAKESLKSNQMPGSTSTQLLADEDLGEEINDLTLNSKNSNPTNEFIKKDEINVPKISDSSDSEYEIDQDTYFNALNEDSNNDNLSGIGEIDSGDDDELPLLHEEEQHMISELQHDIDDGAISFDGSMHEDDLEDDVDEDTQSRIILAKANNTDPDNVFLDGDDEYDEDDEIMSDFDIPFYEDPKFANLHYCEDESEPKLSLSTSLPFAKNDEKTLKLMKKEARKREYEERMKRRKQLRLSEKRNRTSVPGFDNDEYIFNVFFQNSDEEFSNKKPNKKPDKSNRQGKDNGSNSGNESSDNLLSQTAKLASDDDNLNDEDLKELNDMNDEDLNYTDTDSSSLPTDFIEIDDDEDMSVSDVFIDIDDLDPDSFYFQGDSESDTYSTNKSDTNESHKVTKENKNHVLESSTYADDESTDEDDNLPPPSSRRSNIGSKAKEVVSANVVGLKPPKLGTWETNNKPFSIIDGLSTKSLYSLIQEHQQMREQTIRSQSPDSKYEPNSSANSNGDELTLNELLNMSELEDDDKNLSSSGAQAHTRTPGFDWYEKPKVPLSAFRNKGVNTFEDEEYLIPSNSIKKVPIGFIGGERTRKKINKMKDIQRRKTEKKRQLKKRKKLLKLRKEKGKLAKDKSMSALAMGNDNTDRVSGQIRESSMRDISQRRDSEKSVGLNEIHEILGKDSSDLLGGDFGDFEQFNEDDAVILTSLTAPIQLDDFGTDSHNSNWKRRQSFAEAAAENLRFTKNGLFSEAALADIEGIIGNSSFVLED